ncbi:Uncharacterised protein [Mycobacteroides abscessus subsp. abscessus]|nr:Uncharacterised protein [Mycobacteroides abscessus subsp. abscessus]
MRSSTHTKQSFPTRRRNCSPTLDETRFHGLFRPGPEQTAFIRKLAASPGPGGRDKYKKHVEKKGEFGASGTTRSVQNRLGYARAIGNALNGADNAIMVRQRGGTHALFRHGASDTVGWIKTDSPQGGTFFRPAEGSATYLARKARAAKKGNWQRIDLDKARNPRSGKPAVKKENGKPSVAKTAVPKTTVSKVTVARPATSSQEAKASKRVSVSKVQAKGTGVSQSKTRSSSQSPSSGRSTSGSSKGKGRGH